MQKIRCTLMCGFMAVAFVQFAHAQDGVESLLNLSFKELKKIKVTSVSKKPEDSFEAAAAVYVITSDDIRRMGATSIPEVLRVVPGIEVNRINSNKWAITARGINSQFSNKLLVLMDGRTLYTPLFSGVYWDIQDTLLEDIARIEVIRGPGATLWGANAVNGVINIITKSAKNTQGHYYSALVGNEDRIIGSARYGGKIGDNLHYRTYVKHLDRDASETQDKIDANDDWYVSRSGFRVDWDKSALDRFSFHGDLYNGLNRQDYYLPGTTGTTEGDESYRGGNFVSKWDRSLSDESSLSLQMYVDHVERHTSILDQERTTIDLDFQHVWDINTRNELIWGLGYRYFQDDLDEKNISGTTYLDYTPNNSNNNLYSAFLQNKYSVIPETLYLTLGSKFEYHYYTEFECQPNARLTWLPKDNQTVWASVSHAVRTPTRGEHGLVLVAVPSSLNQTGSLQYESENLMAYEVGYRIQPNWRTSLDVAAFFNDYDKLRTFEADGINRVADNNAHGETYGVEVSSRYSLTRDWNLYANYSFLTMDLHLDPGVTQDFFKLEDDEGRSAKNRFSLLSRINLPHNVELDNNVMYVDNLSGLSIPGYIRVDARLGWKPKKGIELSLVGQNLFDDHHPEFSQSLYSTASEVERSFYGKVTVKF